MPPYKFEFEAFVRRRWVGRTVWEIMFADFPYYPEECVAFLVREKPRSGVGKRWSSGAPRRYYKTAMLTGRLMLNGETVPVSSVVRDGDVICHVVHRHEVHLHYVSCGMLGCLLTLCSIGFVATRSQHADQSHQGTRRPACRAKARGLCSCCHRSHALSGSCADRGFRRSPFLWPALCSPSPFIRAADTGAHATSHRRARWMLLRQFVCTTGAAFSQRGGSTAGTTA